MTQILEEVHASKVLLPPPSQEVTTEAIRRAKEKGIITQLGADALEGINPELIKSVIEKSGSLSKPLH